MVRKVLCFVLLCLSLFAGEMAVERSYKVELQNFYNLGEFSFYTKSGWGLFGFYQKVRSKLEYPIDVYTPGISLSLISVKENGKKSLINACFSTNLTNPRKKMIDSDWYSDNFADPPIIGKLFSYTESDAKMSEYNLGLELKTDFVAYNDIHFGAIVGYRWQKYYHEMFGFEGWYLPFIDEDVREEHTWSDSEIVLTYDIAFKAFYVGALLNYDGNQTGYGIDVKISPFASIKATDDHVLRQMLVEQTSEQGYFYEVGLFFNYKFAFAYNGFTLTAEYLNTNYSLDGHSIFEYYDGEYRGQKSSKISTEFDYRRNRFGLNLAMDF